MNDKKIRRPTCPSQREWKEQKKKKQKKPRQKWDRHPILPASRAKPPDPLHPAAFDPACWVDTAFIIMFNPPHLSF